MDKWFYICGRFLGIEDSYKEYILWKGIVFKLMITDFILLWIQRHVYKKR